MKSSDCVVQRGSYTPKTMNPLDLLQIIVYYLVEVKVGILLNQVEATV